MSLIKCPECGKNFSDKAISCPNCGYPVKANYYPKRKNDGNDDALPKGKVIEHLKHVAFLEKAIFAYKTAYADIEEQISSLGIRKRFKEPEPVMVLASIEISACLIIPVFLITAVILSLTSGSFWTDLICLITVV